MDFLEDNFDIQSSVELNDIDEKLVVNEHSQRLENILAQINAKLEKLSPEERKKYLCDLRKKINDAIVEKEKTFFENYSTMTTENDNMIDFDISMLKPIDEEIEEEVINFDVSSIRPIDSIEHHHKR